MFVGVAPSSSGAERLFEADLAERGYVMNASRMWAYAPEAHDGLFDLMKQSTRDASLTLRQRGILVSACAATLGDAYCSLAWGEKLAAEAGEEVAAGVLRGDDTGLDAREQALARWARRVARNPNGTDPADVEELRAVGYDDGQIVAITVYVALRLAFSTVNDALGARPDPQLGERVPSAVRAAVTYGRPVGTEAD